MLTNMRRFKAKIEDLHLPWWFHLVKSGIPYTLATVISMNVMLALGGWVGMPEAVPLLQWVNALFMAMQPAVKFLAVSLVGLGAFLSTLAITSVIVRGFLFSVTEKAAVEALAVGELLLEDNKELQQNMGTQVGLTEEYQKQIEFLKGYAKGRRVAAHSDASLDIMESKEENQHAEPVLFSSKTKAKTEKDRSKLAPRQFGWTVEPIVDTHISGKSHPRRGSLSS